MIILAYYLIASLISVYSYKPTNKVELWKSTLVIPVVLTIWYILKFLNESNGYYGYSMYGFGKNLSKCIIPLLISCFTTFYLLKSKMKNSNKLKFPLVLFLSTIFVSGFALYKGSFQNEIKKDSDSITPLLQQKSEKKIAVHGIEIATTLLKNKLPVNVGDGIVLYNVSFNEKDKVVEYFYKNDLEEISNLSEDNINDYKTEWREKSRQTANKSKNKQEFITADITMKFILVDKKNDFILDFYLSPADYK